MADTKEPKASIDNPILRHSKKRGFYYVDCGEPYIPRILTNEEAEKAKKVYKKVYED